jgi:membrane protein YqaA with SNARE-associated domain
MFAIFFIFAKRRKVSTVVTTGKVTTDYIGWYLSCVIKTLAISHFYEVKVEHYHQNSHIHQVGVWLLVCVILHQTFL